MTFTIIWMLVLLKIPVIAALWIVWWAIRAEPVPEDPTGRDGGSRVNPRCHPRPRHPRPPRRGPHAAPAPPAPARVRARGRRLVRTH